MSLDADLIVDRRRMRRKLTFWRVVAVLIAIAAIVALAATMRRSEVLTAGGDYFARVKITGLIRNDQERTKSLERLAKSSAKAVIVHIDSPGGTTAGSEQLHNSLRAGRRRQAAGGRGRRARGLGRLHRRDERRPHRGAGHLAGRLDRRDVAVSERRRPAEDHRREGRVGKILAAQGRAERLRADQPRGARRAGVAGEGFLRLVPRHGARPPQDGRRDLAARRRRPRVHRPPGDRTQARRCSSATSRPRSTGSPRRRG